MVVGVGINIFLFTLAVIRGKTSATGPGPYLTDCYYMLQNDGQPYKPVIKPPVKSFLIDCFDHGLPTAIDR